MNWESLNGLFKTTDQAYREVSASVIRLLKGPSSQVERGLSSLQGVEVRKLETRH